MRKVVMCLAGGAVAAVAAVAAQPAKALPIADGSFTLQAVLKGKFTVNTVNIAANTSSVTDPKLIVQDVSPTGNLASVIDAGDSASLSPSTLPVPTTIGAFVTISPFTLTVDGIVFTFNTVKMAQTII